MKIAKISGFLVLAVALAVQLFAQKTAELTVKLSEKSEVAIIDVEVRPAVHVSELDTVELDEENAISIRRGRERAFALEAGKAYTVLAVRKWEGRLYRFAQNVSLPADGAHVVVLPRVVE